MEIFGEILCEKKFFYLFGMPNFSEENIKALEQVLLKNYQPTIESVRHFFLISFRRHLELVNRI